MHKFLACCLLLSCSLPALADDWYQVELVLFAYIGPDTDDELWYENPGLPQRDQTIRLITETTDPADDATPATPDQQKLTPYLALPKQAYRLAGVRQVLALSENYRPLLHVAWQQPGLDRRNVRAVYLENTQFDRTAAQWEPEAVADRSGYTPPEQVFKGTVRLRKARFLHLDVDFVYFFNTPKQPSPAASEENIGANQAAADYLRLRQSRKIKTGELNYFDHPLFGLLIQVSRKLPADNRD